jgi:hypothetical protein
MKFSVHLREDRPRREMRLWVVQRCFISQSEYEMVLCVDDLDIRFIGKLAFPSLGMTSSTVDLTRPLL